MEKESRTRLTVREGRRFGLSVGLAFVLLGALLWWREHNGGSAITATLGTLLTLAAIAIPTRLQPVYVVWMGMAALISKITTPIFMGAIYLAVLTPAGILMRALGYNPLARKKTRTGFWISREHPKARDMHRLF